MKDNKYYVVIGGNYIEEFETAREAIKAVFETAYAICRLDSNKHFEDLMQPKDFKNIDWFLLNEIDYVFLMGDIEVVRDTEKPEPCFLNWNENTFLVYSAFTVNRYLGTISITKL